MQDDVAVHIDVTPFALAIVEVMLAPYREFIVRLLGEGTVTTAEIKEVNALAAERARVGDERATPRTVTSGCAARHIAYRVGKVHPPALALIFADP